jgi:hypothetical protein
MKILTDDPDWARDIYEARALAMIFVRKHESMGARCRAARAYKWSITA